MTQLRKRHSLPLSMHAVVGEIFGSKMNPFPVIIFLIKCLARSIFKKKVVYSSAKLMQMEWKVVSSQHAVDILTRSFVCHMQSSLAFSHLMQTFMTSLVLPSFGYNCNGILLSCFPLFFALVHQTFTLLKFSSAICFVLFAFRSNLTLVQ